MAKIEPTQNTLGGCDSDGEAHAALCINQTVITLPIIRKSQARSFSGTHNDMRLLGSRVEDRVIASTVLTAWSGLETGESPSLTSHHPSS